MWCLTAEEHESANVFPNINCAISVCWNNSGLHHQAICISFRMQYLTMLFKPVTQQIDKLPFVDLVGEKNHPSLSNRPCPWWNARWQWYPIWPVYHVWHLWWMAHFCNHQRLWWQGRTCLQHTGCNGSRLHHSSIHHFMEFCAGRHRHLGYTAHHLAG